MSKANNKYIMSDLELYLSFVDSFKKKIEPDVGVSISEIIFNKVDLPLPDFPTIEKNPFSGSINDTSFKTLRFPLDVTYSLLTFDNLNRYMKKPSIYL